MPFWEMCYIYATVQMGQGKELVLAIGAVTRDEMKTRQEFCETLAYRQGGLGFSCIGE